MPKTITKRAKPKTPKVKAPDAQGYELEDGAPPEAQPVAVTRMAEPPPEPAGAAEPVRTASSADLQTPSTPIEPEVETKPTRPAPHRDQIASTINIAKLQAMSMTALNTMAR